MELADVADLDRRFGIPGIARVFEGNDGLAKVAKRAAQSKGSINKHGNFQTDFMGMGVEVKDSSLPDKWAYFNFDDNPTAAANPKQACFSCHEKNAAVERSFVQFYPTLKPVAQKFGTYRQSAEDVQ